jgi:hypothetical protein
MPRPVRLAPYLTLRELLKLLGRPTGRVERQQLGRHLRSREAALGVTFLRRLGPGRNSPLVVTLPLLREHCPELFDRRSEAEELAREHIAELRETVLDLKAGQRTLAAKLRIALAMSKPQNG